MPDAGPNQGYAGLVVSPVALAAGANIVTSSHFGNAGNVDISILSGPQGLFGTQPSDPSADMGSAHDLPMNFIENSLFGNGGNFVASVGGQVSTSWAVSANGQNGGTIFVRGGGYTTLNGNFTADGTLSSGGNVLMSAYSNLTVNGYIQAQGGSVSGLQGPGGNIVLESLKNAVVVAGNANGVALDASGTAGGGAVTVMAANGINIGGQVNVSSIADDGNASGGRVTMVSFLPFNDIRFLLPAGSTAIAANGIGAGGSVSIVSGANVDLGGLDVNVAGTGGQGVGGAVFISAGSTNTLSLPAVNAGGAAGAGAVTVLSNGGIDGSGLGSGAGVLSLSAFAGSRSNVFSSTAASGSLNYTLVAQPGSAPYLQDSNGNQYLLPAGVISTSTTGNSLSMGNLQVSGSGAVPLVVMGDLSAGRVAGSGSGVVSLVSSGNMSLSGSLTNVSGTTGTAGGVAALAAGALSIGGFVSTSATAGSSGAVQLLGSSVAVSGANAAGSSLDASNSTGTSNGGNIMAAAVSGDLVLGAWSNPTSVTGGNVTSYSTGSINTVPNTAGNVFLFGFGNVAAGSVLAGGVANASGGMVTIAAGDASTLGSLSNRSTTATTVAGLTAFANDTGLGQSSGLNVLGDVSFLSGSVVLTDGSNDFSVNSVNLVHTPTFAAYALPAQIVTTNLLGPAGQIHIVAPAVLGVDVYTLDSSSPTGNGGSIVITNPLGSLTFHNDVNTSGFGPVGFAGNITLGALGDITGHNLTSSASGGAMAGNVGIDTLGGVSFNAIDTSSTGPNASGGNILINARGDIGIQSLNASASSLAVGGLMSIYSAYGAVSLGSITDFGSNTNYTGGYVNVFARNDLTITGPVDVRGLANANAGNVNLLSYVDLSGNTAGAHGSGGFLTAEAIVGSVNLAGNVNVEGAGAGNHAGSIMLNAWGSLNLGSSNLIASATGTEGGHVALQAVTGALTDSGTVDVSAAGGQGGTVLMVVSGAGAINAGNIAAYGSGTGNSGGKVLLFAPSNSIAVGNIDASGVAGASGGLVDITGKASVSFGAAATPLAYTLNGSSYSTTGINVSGDAGGGRLVVGSAGLVSSATGITGTSAGGTGADILVTSGGSSLNGGAPVSISLGDINVSGQTGGTVQVYSLDLSGGSINLGSIVGQAAGTQGVGAAVAVAGLGAVNIAGNILVDNTNAAAGAQAAGGAVFVSSASTINLGQGTNFTVGNVNASAASPGSESGQIILVATGAINQSGANTVANSGLGFYSNYTAGPGALTAGGTITVTPAQLQNYNPAGFATVNTPSPTMSSNSTITVDDGGNARAIVPILSRSGMTVGGEIVAAAGSGQQAGSITLVSLDNMSLSGSVLSNGAISGGAVRLISVLGNVNTNYGNGLGGSTIDVSGSNYGGSINIAAPLASVTTGILTSNGGLEGGTINLVAA